MQPQINHDDPTTLLTNEIELTAEALEEVIAPGTRLNHNETLASDEIELSIEELEEVIAPGYDRQHNETLLND